VSSFAFIVFKLQRNSQPIRRTAAGNSEERTTQIEHVQERLKRLHPLSAEEAATIGRQRCILGSSAERAKKAD
jgi:hypothetical protein